MNEISPFIILQGEICYLYLTVEEILNTHSINSNNFKGLLFENKDDIENKNGEYNIE